MRKSSHRAANVVCISVAKPSDATPQIVRGNAGVGVNATNNVSARGLDSEIQSHRSDSPGVTEHLNTGMRACVLTDNRQRRVSAHPVDDQDFKATYRIIISKNGFQALYDEVFLVSARDDYAQAREFIGYFAFQRRPIHDLLEGH